MSAVPSGPEIVVFWFLALAIVLGAGFTMTRRNPVTAVVSLVGTFFALAALYATMSAHFLAILQVLVYAGAIMVLFIFVVMILNREEVTPVSVNLGLIPRLAGVAAGAYLLAKFARLASARDSGLPAGKPEPDAGYGTVAAIGDLLFRDFLFPFEAISLLLLVAVVGGVVLSRSAKQEAAAGAAAERQRAITSLSGENHAHAGGDAGHGAGGHGAGH